MAPLIPKINLIFFKIDQIFFACFKKFEKRKKVLYKRKALKNILKEREKGKKS